VNKLYDIESIEVEFSLIRSLVFKAESQSVLEKSKESFFAKTPISCRWVWQSVKLISERFLAKASSFARAWLVLSDFAIWILSKSVWYNLFSPEPTLFSTSKSENLLTKFLLLVTASSWLKSVALLFLKLI